MQRPHASEVSSYISELVVLRVHRVQWLTSVPAHCGRTLKGDRQGLYHTLIPVATVNPTAVIVFLEEGGSRVGQPAQQSVNLCGAIVNLLVSAVQRGQRHTSIPVSLWKGP